MKAFFVGLLIALALAAAMGFGYGAFEISAEQYFSTEAARL